MPYAPNNRWQIVAGDRQTLGPFYAWNPSTGSRLNLSGAVGRLVAYDRPAGARLFAVSTTTSVAGNGVLKFSAAASGKYYVSLFSGATSTYGGVLAQWELKISTAGRTGELTIQRGMLQVLDTLR